MKRHLQFLILSAPVALLVVTGWLAYPATGMQPLPNTLKPAESGILPDAVYAKDAQPLIAGFRSQEYRSFCGPASLATVLRAYGNQEADQRTLFPSLIAKANVFYSGMSLSELSSLATSVGVKNKIVYADTLSLDDFRARVKENLSNSGDFVLVNYARQSVGEDGGGHISPIAAFDPTSDAFLVLDEAGYKYPFTWIPAELLYKATRTKDGDHFRGLLFTSEYTHVR